MEIIKFPNSLISLGDSNFNYANSLKIIAIPGSVTSIGKKSSITNDDIKIYCKSDSYAKQYAIENGYNYVTDDIAPIISEVNITDDVSGAKRLTVTASDENEVLGLADYAYSFDGGKTWQAEPYKLFTKNTEVEIMVIDSVGNTSEVIINVETTIADLSKNEDLSIIAKLEDNSKLVISGSGEMKNLKKLSENEEFWKENNIDKTKITSIEIGEGITTIGDYIFGNFESLKIVNLPSTISLIGNGAFQYCYKLNSINIPYSVKKIGEYAFGCCMKLNCEIRTENIEYIEPWAFLACENIQNIFINNNTEYIGQNALYEVNNVYYNSASDAMKEYFSISSLDFSTQFMVDNIAPEVTNIEKNNEKIIVTAIDKGGTKEEPNENGSGVYLYSFDGGATWQESNEYIGDINNIDLIVKDNVGNEAKTIMSTTPVEKEFYKLSITHPDMGKRISINNTICESIKNDNTITDVYNYKPGDTIDIKLSDVDGYYIKDFKIDGKQVEGYEYKSTINSDKDVTITMAKNNSLIKLSKTSANVSSFETLKLIANLKNKNATNVKWGTSNSKLATVSSNGTVTPKWKANGKSVYITASSTYMGRNVEVKSKITIKKPELENLKVSKITTKSANLSWSKIKGADGYKIYKYNKNTKKYELYKTIKSNNCTITKLNSKTSYKFRVIGYKKIDGKVCNSKALTITCKTK